MSNPDQIERVTAKTRDSLSKDVARLNDKVSPAKFLSRRTDKLKETAGSMKDRLMGSSDSPGDAAKDKAGSAVASMKDATDSLGSKVSDAVSTDAIRQQAQGNPIAAGLIAFGVGWLLSSLVPASRVEQHAAERIEDKSSALVDPLKQSAQEVAGNLQQPLQDAAGSIKQTTSDATNKTTEHAKSAAADVKDNAQDQAQK